jgi:hypothetical protein
VTRPRRGGGRAGATLEHGAPAWHAPNVRRSGMRSTCVAARSTCAKPQQPPSAHCTSQGASGARTHLQVWLVVKRVLHGSRRQHGAQPLRSRKRASTDSYLLCAGAHSARRDAPLV